MNAVRVACLFLLASLVTSVARAEDSRVVVVLPLDVSRAKLDSASRLAFEETIRTVTGDVLVPLGFRVLTGETTLRYIVENGLDPERACTAQCALEAARELKAQFFISGSIATTEGEQVAFVRLFESESGQQLTSLQLEGHLIKELRASFKEQSRSFFARALSSPFVQTSKADQVHATTRREIGLEDGAVSNDALVRFRTEPPGALVELDGDVICQQTPCARNLATGEHIVTLKRESYETYSQKLSLAPGAIVSQSLTPTFGTLTVETDPPGLALTINGKTQGKSPIISRALVPGTYDVALDDLCWRRELKSIALARGEQRLVTLPTNPRLGRLKVTAELQNGEAVAAAILLRDQRVGTTPAALELPVCTRQVEVATTDGRRQARTVELKEGAVTSLRVVFPNRPVTLSPSTAVQPILARAAAAQHASWPKTVGEADLDVTTPAATGKGLDDLDRELARLRHELEATRVDARKAEHLFAIGDVLTQKSRLVASMDEVRAFETARKGWAQCRRENPQGLCGAEPLPNRARSDALRKQAIGAYEELVSRYPQAKQADAALFAIADDASMRVPDEGGTSEAEREQRRAMSLLTQFTSQYPSSLLAAAALLRTGELALRQNDLPVAKKALEEANRRERGQSARILYRLAAIEFRQDRTDEATRLLKDAYARTAQMREEQPRELLRTAILKELTLVFERAGAPRPAFDFYRQTLGKERAKTYAIRLADASLERAGYDYASHGYQNAIEAYRYLLSEYPLDPIAPEWLAKLVVASDKMGSEPGLREHISALLDLSASGSEWSRANAFDEAARNDARSLADALRRFNTPPTR